MRPTSELCRTQEALQRERAEKATLENVRTVALKAAKAWGIEAKAAEKSEAQREAFHAAKLAGLICLDEESEFEDDAVFSENPDRLDAV